GRGLRAAVDPHGMPIMLSERVFRRALVLIAVVGLLLGLLAWALGRSDVANWGWAGGTIPVVIGLLMSIIRDLLAGRLVVDAGALVAMSGDLALGQNLGGIVVAIMYAGGNILEDFAVARAERDLRSLIDRAPKVAHRRMGSTFEDVPIERIVVGDDILVRAGEVVPVDGVIVSPLAMLDEAPLLPASRFRSIARRASWLGAARSMRARRSSCARPRR